MDEQIVCRANQYFNIFTKKDWLPKKILPLRFIHLYHIYLSLNNKHQYTAVHVWYAILFIFLFLKYFSILRIHSIVFFDDNEILPVEPLNLNCSGRLCKDLNLCMSTSSSNEPTFLPSDNMDYTLCINMIYCIL